jgi:hypothetical protein
MSTSGVSTYNITRDGLIAGALRLIGAVAQGETPTATQVTEAAEALNLMVKAWEADGMPLWGLTEYALTLTANVGVYTIGLGQTINIPKPLRVIQAWNTTGNIDTPMRILTKQEYNILGNKQSPGTPIQCYYDPRLSSGDLHLFPIPDTTAASNYTVTFIYQRPFEDFVASTDNPDFPQEWLEALKYGLAVRLAPEYGLPIEQRQALRAEAKEIKDVALGMGTEEGSLYFQRDFRAW